MNRPDEKKQYKLHLEFINSNEPMNKKSPLGGNDSILLGKYIGK
jgi:hypothetical protein